jgi:hypothetical protein
MANEVRLIDANALRKRMFSYYSCVDENSSKEYYKGETLMSYEVADMIEDCIDNAPTVDAVEVVRCKDCTYCDKAFDDYWCNYHWNYVPPIKPKQTREDGFCHNGEKKDNGTSKIG